MSSSGMSKTNCGDMVGTGINNLVTFNDQNCLLSVYVLIVHRFYGPSLHLIECRRSTYLFLSSHPYYLNFRLIKPRAFACRPSSNPRSLSAFLKLRVVHGW